MQENKNHYKIGKQLGKIRFSPVKGATEIINPSIWKKDVRASFKEVIAFDLLFMALGGFIGAGIVTAVLLK
ncbi:MAG: hypothetical protein KGI33_10775 [Thaumarchaeota archaeon]|nr:hypothetical protein [Nitrososphaerota archaeon]